MKTTITNENRPNTEVRNSNELYHSPDQSQHDRNTDTMSAFHKDWEDNYNQGNHNTGTTNAPKLQADHISLPRLMQSIGNSCNFLLMPGPLQSSSPLHQPKTSSESPKISNVTHCSLDTSQLTGMSNTSLSFLWQGAMSKVMCSRLADFRRHPIISKAESIKALRVYAQPSLPASFIQSLPK